MQKEQIQQSIRSTEQYITEQLLPEKHSSQRRADLKQEQIDEYGKFLTHLEQNSQEGLVQFDCGISVETVLDDADPFIVALPVALSFGQHPDLYLEFSKAEAQSFLQELTPILQQSFTASREHSITASTRLQKMQLLLAQLEESS